MYENHRNTDLKQRIIAILDKNNQNKEELLSILFNELKGLKIYENSVIGYCNCGYPLSCQNEGRNEWIAEILKQEVDFRSYREFYYCPKCNNFLAEFQH